MILISHGLSHWLLDSTHTIAMPEKRMAGAVESHGANLSAVPSDPLVTSAMEKDK